MLYPVLSVYTCHVPGGHARWRLIPPEMGGRGRVHRPAHTPGHRGRAGGPEGDGGSEKRMSGLPESTRCFCTVSPQSHRREGTKMPPRKVGLAWVSRDLGEAGSTLRIGCHCSVSPGPSGLSFILFVICRSLEISLTRWHSS